MTQSWDSRRDYIVPGNKEETVLFAAQNWAHLAKRAIQQKGRFAVALSGGSTPEAIYQKIIYEDLDWSKVWLFWSDERAVSPDHPESNYKMAMKYFHSVPIPPSQIFRMKAEEKDLFKASADYEKNILHYLDKHLFDLVMLGMGEDGHTASLFPNTEALKESKRLVCPNYILEKKSWRMTFTFPCINQSSHSILYVLGSSKKKIVYEVLKAPIESQYPASQIGTSERKALWIFDQDASPKK